MRNRKWLLELLVSTGVSQQQAEIIADRLQEENILHLGYGDKDVDDIVDTFRDAFGTTKTTKQDRFAADRLAKAHGAKAVTAIIRMLAQRSSEPYVPVVNNVSELEKKLQSILHFLRRAQGEVLKF